MRGKTLAGIEEALHTPQPIEPWRAAKRSAAARHAANVRWGMERESKGAAPKGKKDSGSTH